MNRSYGIFSVGVFFLDFIPGTIHPQNHKKFDQSAILQSTLHQVPDCGMSEGTEYNHTTNHHRDSLFIVTSQYYDK